MSKWQSSIASDNFEWIDFMASYWRLPPTHPSIHSSAFMRLLFLLSAKFFFFLAQRQSPNSTRDIYSYGKNAPIFLDFFLFFLVLFYYDDDDDDDDHDYYYYQFLCVSQFVYLVVVVMLFAIFFSTLRDLPLSRPFIIVLKLETNEYHWKVELI